MEKILKPYTIIPDNLYVQRDADKQVRNIISDMGRPGYVLVSRQMGKTNLLLNAKRNLETIKDAFIYIDLSNTFPTAKSCFENIIDSAIEAYPDKFTEVSKIIIERRRELKDTPPHKQHTNELRFLLQAINGGRIVIILDEIDALTKTDYSDQIFSQIRSTYFASRVNYKEFFNLTYLLSGVVEPNEIIKDPKVSPFNIGQKIYLNDFSRTEFNEFIKIANLDINQACKDRIFYWTNGNPRISWDVCSEVENRIKVKECEISVIDKIVQDLYLTSFDKAPIDNIREIVSLDREIRNSIVEIEYNKGKLVSDKVKSKLYLAGIINYDEDDIHIKNEIIRKSLSYDWIRSLEEKEKGLLELAMEDYRNLRYSEALITFEKYLENNKEFKDNSAKPQYLYAMGLCAYTLKDYEKAIACFEEAHFDQDDEPKFYFELLCRKAFTYNFLNKIEESLENFRKIINYGKKDRIYAIALLHYGLCSLKSGKVNHKSDSVKIFNEIINETAFKKDKLTATVISYLKSIAHYALAEIASVDNDESEALSNYLEAIKLGEKESKPRYILAYIKLNKNQQENRLLLNDLIDTIIAGEIPLRQELENSIGFELDEFKQIAVLSFIYSKDNLFNKLIPHLSAMGNKDVFTHLYELAIFSIENDGHWENGLKLLDYIYDSYKSKTETIQEETTYNVLKLLGSSTDRKDKEAIQLEYIDIFKEKRLAAIDVFDLNIFVSLVFSLTQEKKYTEALEYIKIISSLQESVPEYILINYLVIHHLELNIYAYLKDREKLTLKAKELIELANDKRVKGRKSFLLGDSGLDVIKQNAESILRSVNQEPRSSKKEERFERNQILKVRYKDGTIIEAKFKKIEDDIAAGNCFVLS